MNSLSGMYTYISVAMPKRTIIAVTAVTRTLVYVYRPAMSFAANWYVYTKIMSVYGSPQDQDRVFSCTLEIYLVKESVRSGDMLSYAYVQLADALLILLHILSYVYRICMPGRRPARFGVARIVPFVKRAV